MNEEQMMYIMNIGNVAMKIAIRANQQGKVSRRQKDDLMFLHI